MLVPLLAALTARSWAVDDVTTTDPRLHFRSSKRPLAIENLDTTVRTRSQLYALELVVTTKVAPTVNWRLCAAVLTEAEKEPDLSKAVCVTLVPKAWQGPATGRMLSQGLSVPGVFAGSALNAAVENPENNEGTHHLVVWIEDQITDGVEHEPAMLSRQATVIYDDSTPVVQFDLVTHPGMYVAAGIQCENLLDAGAESPPACDRNPFGTVMSDQFAIAPAGVHLRFAPFSDLPWLGFAMDASAAVVGPAIEATGKDVDDKGTPAGFQASPVAFGAGIDFQVPIGSQRINIGVQGGAVLSPLTLETLRWNPAFMVVTSVPIATLKAL